MGLLLGPFDWFWAHLLPTWRHMIGYWDVSPDRGLVQVSQRAPTETNPTKLRPLRKLAKRTAERRGEIRIMVMRWLTRMTSAFGAVFLWLVCLVYFTQGFRSFAWTAVSYQLKDILKLSPSASQFVISVAFFPWNIKPLYGIVSDCIPIKGRKRVPYLIISTVFSLLPWILLSLNAPSRSLTWNLTILLTIQNLGSAMADVVIDAMIAEAVRFEQASFAGDLQSLSWFSMAFGGICGSLLGGYALSNFQIATIFLLFSILPAIQLGSCYFIKEKPLGREVSLDFPIKDIDKADRNGHNVVKEESVVKKPNGSASRRKKSQNNREIKPRSDATNVVKKEDTLTLKWFHSLKEATYSLCRAFRQPSILRPMAWFFLAHIAVPNLSTVMFYYQTEELKLDAAFLGTSRVIGWIGLMIGTFIYNRFFKMMKLRTILLLAQSGLLTMTLLDMVLVARMNDYFGVSDKLMVAGGSALADAINQLKFMPFLILSGQLCPPGIEGTLFALFMSINNLGSTIGSFLGAGLASLLNISSGSFDNLLLGITIQAACILVPVAFLFLIPKEATGVSA